MDRNLAAAVIEILESMKSGVNGDLVPLKSLFWEQLNYESADQRLPKPDIDAAKSLADSPLLLASGGDGFHIIYMRLDSDRLSRTTERLIVHKLIAEYPYALFIFSDRDRRHWHFINVKDTELAGGAGASVSERRSRIFRRITIGPDERLRTASERVAMLDIADLGESPSALQIKQRHNEAFDVEKVTEKFYEQYKEIFLDLWKHLKRNTKDNILSHDYALQFLNRCMFIYFIQRKRWLGGDTEFMRAYFKTYRKSDRPKDTFVEEWIKPLFFEAFNNRKNLLNANMRAYLPDDIRRILHKAPYLNGGLFKENHLDEKCDAKIPDRLFEEVFDFFESYNFTIAEDSPLDQEVAVDPEMIGRVYESLVNVSDEAKEQGEAGIFYTQRTEIELMCRLALCDNLVNHIGEKHRAAVNNFVFALEPDEKEEADKAVTRAGIWREIHDRLETITAVDPACGSGSFLVGMLHALDDLLQRSGGRAERETNPHERKKHIIGRSLYGVDVMEWACRVAELRLWLALIIDADFTPEELAVRAEPLLPDFTFNIRCGDSLVQEVAGINMADVRAWDKGIGLPPETRQRLADLRRAKRAYYENNPLPAFKNINRIRDEELKVFKEILRDQIGRIRNEMAVKNKTLKKGLVRELSFDDSDGSDSDYNAKRARMESEIERLEGEIDALETACASLTDPKDVPFVWSIAFAEIMQSAGHGFDIVIGNPPYVRQENIAAPKVGGKRLTDDKGEYKNKLAHTIYPLFPGFFGLNGAKRKLNAKNDLYVYFYFVSMSLLNERGSFCFITSNSWLDVGYGADLQEFLLRSYPIRLIIDNSARRSFSRADVNTVISLFSAPGVLAKGVKLDDHLARFVMFTTPFDAALSPLIFQEIFEANDRAKKPEYRVFPITHGELLKSGTPPADPDKKESKKASQPKFSGDKWGGKYLRAPDIYWTILKKGQGKLVRLGDVAEVRFGIKTGANEFFYLNEERIREWGIEKEFLKPVIVSPRESESILIKPENLKYKAFVCNKKKRELKDTIALQYIKWGEKEGFNSRPSCRSRKEWHYFPEKDWGIVLWSMIHNDRHLAFWNKYQVAVDHNLFEILSSNIENVWGSLSWTAQVLFRELHGRSNLGQGALKTEGIDIKTLVCLSNEFSLESEIITARKKIMTRKILNLRSDIEMSDRQELDNIFFDFLGLTKGERDAVYEAVIELVETRLKKASSV